MKLIYGIHAVKAALGRPEIKGKLLVDKVRKDERINNLIELAQAKNITISLVAKVELNRRTKDLHQGVILLSEKSANTNGETELFALIKAKQKFILLLVLDGVTDPHNLGACLRVADGAGVDGLIVPKDNSASLTPSAIKVASGAAESVPLFKVSNLARVLKRLADAGVYVIGTDDKADDEIYSFDYSGNLALVLGAEGSGMRRLTKRHCQHLLKIPMQGEVSSLNVATACAVVLFEAVRQRGL